MEININFEGFKLLAALLPCVRARSLMDGFAFDFLSLGSM